MIRKTRWGNIYMAVAVTFLAYSALHAQNPAAIVLDVKGTCRVSRSGAPVFIKKGMFVYENDSLNISAKGAVLLLDSLDRFITVKQSGRYLMPETENAEPRRFFQEWLAARQWFEKTRKKSWDGLRSSSGQEIMLKSPRNTRLRESPGSLNWTAKQGQPTVELSIRCYENDFSFRSTLRDNRFRITDELGLEKGQQYHWSVQPEKGDLTSAPVPVWFEIMTEQQKAQFTEEHILLKDIMARDTLSVAYSLLYAQLLHRHRLFQECRAELESLMKKEADHPVALMFYARIMDQMDLPEQTKRYIELTEKFEH